MVKPFFFGDSDSPLYGVYHPPFASSAEHDCAALICSPIFHEHVRTHRILRQVAAALAEAGFPVLRFDYFGIGDSSGNSEDGTMGRWLADIATAALELKDMSGKKKLTVIGVRMGASLAIQALSKEMSCNRAVLWDPVVSGAGYFNEIGLLHRGLFPNYQGQEESNEVVGFCYPPALHQEIMGIDLTQIHRVAADKILTLFSEERSSYTKFFEALSANHGNCHRIKIENTANWSTPKMIDKLVIANDAIQAIVSFCGER
jgi:pimeloyl-ACP methyl ester carboxylesterase